MIAFELDEHRLKKAVAFYIRSKTSLQHTARFLSIFKDCDGTITVIRESEHFSEEEIIEAVKFYTHSYHASMPSSYELTVELVSTLQSVDRGQGCVTEEVLSAIVTFEEY